MSGPLLDRIDLHIEVDPVSAADLALPPPAEGSGEVAARVVHRIGPLRPLDQIVFVGVTSSHRGQALQACEFLMDYLKTQAPFWKKEETPEGARWVDARVADDAALARWGIEASNA